MVTLAFILSELTPLWYFFGRFVSALSREYPSEYFHDTSQVCRTGPDRVGPEGTLGGILKSHCPSVCVCPFVSPSVHYKSCLSNIS